MEDYYSSDTTVGAIKIKKQIQTKRSQKHVILWYKMGHTVESGRRFNEIGVLNITFLTKVVGGFKCNILYMNARIYCLSKIQNCVSS